MCLSLLFLLALALRRFGRLDVQLLSSMSGLLLSYGLELRPVVGTCHKAVHQYIKQAWSDRNQRLKVGTGEGRVVSLVTFCVLLSMK
jgi:hypothetical protein